MSDGTLGIPLYAAFGAIALLGFVQLFAGLRSDDAAHVRRLRTRAVLLLVVGAGLTVAFVVPTILAIGNIGNVDASERASALAMSISEATNCGVTGFGASLPPLLATIVLSVRRGHLARRERTRRDNPPPASF